MEEGGNGGGKCDMRERRAREQHREKKIDARWREREEQRDVVLLKIANAWIREREGGGNPLFLFPLLVHTAKKSWDR